MFASLNIIKSSSAQTICPVATYKIPVQLNVMQMCGAAQNQACTVTVSSAASYANEGPQRTVDGDDTTTASTSSTLFATTSVSPHWFRVDLVKIRTISSVRLVYGSNRMNGGQLIIGNAATWDGNARSAYVGTTGGTYVMSPMIQGRYVFLTSPLISQNYVMIVNEMSAFTDCQQCPLYSTSLAGSQNVTQCTCIAGYHKNFIDECVACTAGTYGLNGNCLLCEAGKYNNNTAQTSCLNCTANTVSTTGSRLCQCNVGYTGADGSVCTLCAADTYKDTIGYATCRSCWHGSSSTPGSTSNTSCLCKRGLLAIPRVLRVCLALTKQFWEVHCVRPVKKTHPP